MVEKGKLLDKTSVKNHKTKTKIKFYYSFLTLILLFCIVYFSYSAFLNISKCLNLPSKQSKMEKLNQEALAENKKLKNEINNFGSLKSLEAIARNNLKMAGQDEILVIVNKTQTKEEEENKGEKKH